MSGPKQWLREASALAGSSVETVEVIRDESAGGRNDVRRVGDGERTWILKSYLQSSGNPVAREAAGLVVAGSDLAPRLVGVATDPPVLLMEDLGGGRALSDLLHTEPVSAAAAHEATDAVTGWADTLGRLHQHSWGRREDFVEVLERHGGCGSAFDGRVEPPEAVDQLVEAVGELQSLSVELGLPTSEVLAEQVRAVLEPLTDPADSVLSPGDTCPDNNRLLPGPDGGGGAGVVLLDFEFAAFRHPAWDLAYLQVPWPTCWCSWRLPARVVDQAHRAYAERLGPEAWLAREDAADLLDRAVLAWCLASAGWFLRGAMDGDGPAGGPGGEPAPGRRALLLDRLRQAAALGHAGPSDVAGELREALVGRWGEHELALAPAYADG
ncbi:phosphotransferase [Nocardioidaceae bacterium]|nr:phosphotransferase [Nocardioidaceae bacterium]